MTDLITRALRNATDTRAMVIGEGAVEQIGEVFTEPFGTTRTAVVADECTLALAGKRVPENLAAAGMEFADPHIFPGEPRLCAKHENCEALRDVLTPVDVVAVAVSSGTLSDIAKRASGEFGRPYMVAGTAASMDDYTASGSSTALDGFKQTLSCPASRGCVADLTVMSAVPQVMTASGYGNLLGKIPTGADWTLSDVLGTEVVDQGVWKPVQGPLHGTVSRPAEFAVGDVSTTDELVEGLLISGLAMQTRQSSRPASGAGYQFSHLWEMEGHGVDIIPRCLSHGFKVGIGTVVIVALYERLLARDLTGLDIDAAIMVWLTREEMGTGVHEPCSDPRLIEETVAQAFAKWFPPEQLRVRLELLVAVWSELPMRLQEQSLPAAELQGMLGAVGAPAHPQDIGLGWDRFRETYVRAQMVRERCTILDLVLETNLLGELVEELFAPDGFWGRQAPGH